MAAAVANDVDLIAAMADLESADFDFPISDEDTMEEDSHIKGMDASSDVPESDDPALLQAAIRQLQQKLKDAEEKQKAQQNGGINFNNNHENKDSTKTVVWTDAPSASSSPSKSPRSFTRVESRKGERKSFLTEEQEKERQEAMRQQALGITKTTKGVREMFSGMQISDRVVEATWLQDKMEGRRFIKIKFLEGEIKGRGDVVGDWVTIGALGDRSDRVGGTGKPYTLWTLTDLMGVSVRIFMFGDACEYYKKLEAGSMVAILNAEILPPKEGGGFAISVAAHQCLMKLGMASEFGVCKGTVKKDGKPCKAIINTITLNEPITVHRNQGHYCSYHVTKALSTMSSKRHILNATASRGLTVKGTDTNLSRDGVFVIRNKKPLAPTKTPWENQKAHMKTQPGSMEDKENAAPTPMGKTGSATAPKAKIVRGGADVLKALSNSRFGSKMFREEHPNMAATPAAKSSATSLIRKFGVDPVTMRSERLIRADKAASSHSGMNARQILLQNCTVPAQKKSTVSSRFVDAPLTSRASERTMITLDNKPSPRNADLAALIRKVRSGDVRIPAPDPNNELQTKIKRTKTIDSTLPEGPESPKRMRDEKEKDYKEGSEKIHKRSRQELLACLSTSSVIAPTSSGRVVKVGDTMAKSIKKTRAIEEKQRDEEEKRESDPFCLTESMQKLIKSNEKQMENTRDPEVEQQLHQMGLDSIKEAMEKKAIDTKELVVKVVTCHDCKKTNEFVHSFCRENNHNVTHGHATKRWYECTKCHTGRSTLTGRPPVTPCRNERCCGTQYTRIGMRKDRCTGVEKVKARGEEQQKFLRPV